jgi:multiple sugar transport system permease protein
VRRESLLSYLVVGPFAIVLAFPFYWMLMTSLRSDTDLYDLQNVPFKFNTDSPTVANYRFLFEETDYRQWLENTVIVGVVVVGITLVLAVPAGYALARLSGSWGQSVGVGIFLTYLVPPTLLFLPLSRVMADLDLTDRLLSLIVVYPSFTVPFSTWLLMGFFKTIPPELEDAALVDGASRLGALARVVFPLSVPGILTVVIFSFSLVFNEYEDGLVGRPHRADPRRRLLLGRADGRNADSGRPARPALQRVPQPLHRRLHGWSVSLNGRMSQTSPGRWSE